ncbi:MAG: flotillin family protein [Acidimicrobiia bacterium]|nr:flotillin family protein [Acidimicrobiia bacterium]
MDETLLYGLAAAGIALLIILLCVVFVFAKLFRKVEQGRALIVSTRTAVEVTFVGQIVVPIIHKAEMMDISVKTIEIDRRGLEGLICRDNIRADIKVTFFVRVNKTKEDVVKVAQSIGCARASDQITLEELFSAKFSEALKTVGKQLDFEDLYTKREEFRDQIIELIGTHLNGYVLEDAAIDFLEQTPLTSLDPKNILDAQGIRKITELTTAQNVLTNHFQREEQKEIKRKDVEAREAILELERQEADAESRQAREIATVRAREWAETQRVEQEERAKAEAARLRTEEQIGVTTENQTREIEVAEKNRERVIAVEEERVERDRQLEIISREREADLQRIAAERDVEEQRKEVANVIRERIAVEKTVAEQEEAIKRLRKVEEASRDKEAAILNAESEAQEALVKDIKAAEAAEQAATHLARERITLAEADLSAADFEARAKMRLAEGTQAAAAAEGLAEVQVRERDADAVEKLGMAEAKVRAETGKAEGDALRDRLSGEAEGLTEKAEAMGKLDDATRQHEEFRLRVEAIKELQLTEIEARRQIAEAQAGIIGDGLRNADIDIVGGDTMFFDRIAGAIAYGKATDGFVENSLSAQHLLGSLMGDGNGDGLPSSVAGVLERVRALAADIVADERAGLTVAALLRQLIASAEGPKAAALQALLERARELGAADVRVDELADNQPA